MVSYTWSSNGLAVADWRCVCGASSDGDLSSREKALAEANRHVAESQSEDSSES